VQLLRSYALKALAPAYLAAHPTGSAASSAAVGVCTAAGSGTALGSAVGLEEGCPAGAAAAPSYSFDSRADSPRSSSNEGAEIGARGSGNSKDAPKDSLSAEGPACSAIATAKLSTAGGSTAFVTPVGGRVASPALPSSTSPACATKRKFGTARAAAGCEAGKLQ